MIPTIQIIAFAEGGNTPGIVQFVPFLLIFAIFYFLLIAPMRKRQKALQALVENLKKGDRVITNGGLYGTIAAVEDKAVIVKLAENLKVKVAKSSVAGLEGQEDQGGGK